MPSPNDVAEKASALGRELTDEQARLLAGYLDVLLRWNKRMNLVGPRPWDGVLVELIQDSWLLADFLTSLPLPKEPLTLDLGAGAGLPGIPLRMFWDAGEYVLVEIRKKRTVFLRYVLAQAPLPGTRVVEQRAENLPADCLPADLIVSRAFMPWPKLLQLAKTLLAPAGRVVIMSNEPAPGEDALGPGWKLEASSEYAATVSGETKPRYFWGLSPVSISI